MKNKLIIALPLILLSCVKKELAHEVADAGYDYYPLVAGRFSVYEADSIVYTEIPKDTTHYRYRLKEVLTGEFTDAAGQPAWRLERFIKKFSSHQTYQNIPWTIKDVWIVRANNKRIEVVEENQSYTKLVFPVRENDVWNGNAANTEGEQLYRYDYTDRPETLGAFTFSNTLRVIQKDFPTLISDEFREERYARGVGMIYRKFQELYSNNIVTAQPVKDRIEKGVIFTQTLIAHGIEN